MENSKKLNIELKERVLEVRVTKLEGALIRKIRELEYGQFTLVVHKVEGQPIRIEVTPSSSVILQARDGLDLEGATYVDDSINFSK